MEIIKVPRVRLTSEEFNTIEEAFKIIDDIFDTADDVGLEGVVEDILAGFEILFDEYITTQ